MWQQILAGRVWRGSVTNRRKDGVVYFGEETITPVRSDDGELTHFVAVLNDVTERNVAQADLQAANAQLRHLVEHSPAVAYSWKLDAGVVISQVVSENVLRLLGCPQNEAAHRDWWAERIHPDDRDNAVASLGDTLVLGRSRSEYRLRHEDGGYRLIEDTRRVVPGRANEIVGLWHDITEHKHAE